MQKSAKILIITLFIIYLCMVMFFCFYKFGPSALDLGKYFLGIRLDRYAHFIMFFPYPFITWLTCRFTASSDFIRRNAVILTLVSGLVFAGLTEICQDLFFNSRQGDALDFAADSLSILSGCIIVSIIGHPVVRLIDRIFNKQK